MARFTNDTSERRFARRPARAARTSDGGPGPTHVRRPVAAPPRRAAATPRRATTTSRDARPKRAGLPLPVRVALVLAVFVALGTGAYLTWRHLTRGTQAREEITSAIAAVAGSDEAIVPLNEAVGGAIGSMTSEQSAQVSANADAAYEQLEQGKDHVARARALEKYLDERAREVLDALDTSIAAREEMIEAGKQIVEADASVATAQEALSGAVEAMVAAGEKVSAASDAAEQYALYLAKDESATITDGNVPVGYEGEALELLGQATDGVAAAKETFAEADYAAYESYLSARTEAVELMKQADEAILDGDFEAASTALESYNEADAKASELAEALPTSTNDVFVEPYATKTEDARTTYAAATERARDADSKIRAYQGTVAQVTTGAATTAGPADGSASGAATTGADAAAGSAAAISDAASGTSLRGAVVMDAPADSSTSA